MIDVADLLASLPPAAREAVLDGPAHTPPEGIMPNFDNPQSQNRLVIGAATTGFVLITIIFLARIYSRAFCLKRVHIEDGLIVAGFGTLTAYGWCLYYILDKPGLFVHQWDIRLKDLSQFLWVIYLGINFYGATMLSLKPVVLLEWSRTFVPHGTRNTFWWTCHILLVVNILFYGSIKIASNLSCQPHNKIWDKTVQGTCLNEGIIWASYSCLNFVSDIIILILPQKVIWRLKLSRTKKIGVSIVFAFGLLACLAATLRIVTSARYLESTDKTFTVSAVALCCWAELVFLFVVVYHRKTHASSGTYPQPRAAEEASYEQVDEYSLKASGDDQNDSYSHYPNEHALKASEITRTAHVMTISEENNPNMATLRHQQ
ncbi:hypothetical protein E0Z10_g5365 [Xylaria hypoxylon]|uniref:Rhodopsin domain-containing protein n=1 Tax=Xylaria hypoxylon TaxID=37992 RepID=A0A4Z0Z1B6_9PEZI|nr:hypothetical protein E0Z10_g5365 [Xylaria hypoxylon]